MLGRPKAYGPQQAFAWTCHRVSALIWPSKFPGGLREVWGCFCSPHDWPRYCRKGYGRGCLWWGGRLRNGFRFCRGISARGMCVRIAGAADKELYVPECGCDQTQGYAAVKWSEALPWQHSSLLPARCQALKLYFSVWKRLSRLCSPKQWGCGGNGWLTPISNLSTKPKRQQAAGMSRGQLMNFGGVLRVYPLVKGLDKAMGRFPLLLSPGLVIWG